MSDFENLVYKELVNELALWKNDADEIYAISLMLQNEWDNPMWPRLLFSHNPIKPKDIELQPKLSRREELEKRFRKPKQIAPEIEKWNPSTWGGSNGIIIGGSCDEDGNMNDDATKDDQKAMEIREQWLKSLGLWYAVDDTNGMIEGRATFVVATAVFQLCIQIVQRLHSQGVIHNALGKVVPVIIHELECDLDSLAYTREANPPGLSKEYEAWLLQGRRVTPDLKSIEHWPGEWQSKEQQAQKNFLD